MTQVTNEGSDCGPSPAASMTEIVMCRPIRRSVSSGAYTALKCRLVPDEPEPARTGGYACKIADVSDGGFGLVCRKAETSPALFQTGATMTLQASDGERLRVEIRWINKSRLGLKRLSPAAS